MERVEREKTATRLNLIITSPSLHHHFIIIRGHPGHPDSHHYLAVVTRGLHQTLPSLHHLLIITSPSHTRGHLGNPDNHTIIISSHTSHRHQHQHHGSRHGDEADKDLDMDWNYREKIKSLDSGKNSKPDSLFFVLIIREL